ncbi:MULTISPECIES: hypothetical protein [Sporosarcina]|uniref:hypothetical protein n=1 Tax=Sporosarcina TaxID=1569 RepID=UPI001E5D9A91|nr:MULTISPECIES: hypothetical protein [Sporosarcina]
MRELVKTITFSFTSSVFEGTEARETFTFEELEIDESLDEKEIGIELDRIYQAWIWDKLNVSGSIVIDEPDTFQ